jgi:hypothetical protein
MPCDELILPLWTILEETAISKSPVLMKAALLPDDTLPMPCFYHMSSRDLQSYRVQAKRCTLRVAFRHFRRQPPAWIRRPQCRPKPICSNALKDVASLQAGVDVP